ncbi:hypothetical protein QWZ13_06080 [Reinekea marina]|nr:hypothetical protein [Reinekea marina]MDN3648475.1 hypothetical protein [Reinekea marina]
MKSLKEPTNIVVELPWGFFVPFTFCFRQKNGAFWIRNAGLFP